MSWLGQKDIEDLENFESTEEDTKDNHIEHIPANEEEERVGKQVPMESFTDKFTQKTAITDVEGKPPKKESERGEKQKEIPRNHSFELTQSVV